MNETIECLFIKTISKTWKLKQACYIWQHLAEFLCKWNIYIIYTHIYIWITYIVILCLFEIFYSITSSPEIDLKLYYEKASSYIPLQIIISKIDHFNSISQYPFERSQHSIYLCNLVHFTKSKAHGMQANSIIIGTSEEKQYQTNMQCFLLAYNLILSSLGVFF